MVPATVSASPLQSFGASAACADVTTSSQVVAPQGTGMQCIFTKYVNPFVKFFAALVGVAVVISVIWGALLYQSSAGDPGKVAAAKGKIYQAIIALVIFLFLMAALQWLIPGGINAGANT
jgi:hypothetical protein